MTSIRITAVPADSDGPMIVGAGAASAKEDGSFELKGLAGPRLIRLAICRRVDAEIRAS